jgi:hypothetical protein
LQMIFDEMVHAGQESHLQGRTFYNSILFKFFITRQFRSIIKNLIYKI